jgi:hypothetical protein
MIKSMDDSSPNKKIVNALGLIASIITLYMFIFGIQNLKEFYNKIGILDPFKGLNPKITNQDSSRSSEPGKNGQNDHLRPEQRDHPLAGAN